MVNIIICVRNSNIDGYFYQSNFYCSLFNIKMKSNC